VTARLVLDKLDLDLPSLAPGLAIIIVVVIVGRTWAWSLYTSAGITSIARGSAGTIAGELGGNIVVDARRQFSIDVGHGEDEYIVE
jgi:hypothetical protein